MPQSKDLFDDSTMTFGEHLEVLRVHLIRALLGLVIGVVVSLTFGNRVIDLIRMPLDNALEDYGIELTEKERKEREALRNFDFFGTAREWLGWGATEDEAEVAARDAAAEENGGGKPRARDEESRAEDGKPAPKESPKPPKLEQQPPAGTIPVTVSVAELVGALHTVDPATFPEPAEDETRLVELQLTSPAFEDYEARLVGARTPQAVTLTVQEAFMTFLKVAFVTGFVISAPWIFYQIWLFVAAGLYPHERKYVHIYLPMSVGLFFVGAVFCFFAVFPFVLDFLLSFNEWLGVEPVIRLTEWINFAIVLPLMFGISFQLPLVMLFLERISIFEVQQYQSQWRMAVLVIAIVSMLLTPADPASMMMMMCPLVLLYVLGIALCRFSPAKTPFEQPSPA